jgi:hypothetical protein
MRRLRGTLRPLQLLACAILILAGAAGCPFGVNVPGERQAPVTSDVFETGPGSLLVEVTGYGWEYIGSGSHVRIHGNVVNNTGRPIQGVIIQALLHDQEGRPMAFGETYVAPTYLPAGGSGSFDFVALAKRSSGVTATRLVTVARLLASY